MDTYHRIVDWEMGGPALLLHFDDHNVGTGGFVLDNPQPECSSLPPFYCYYHEDAYFIDSSKHNHPITRTMSEPIFHDPADDIQIVNDGMFGKCARAGDYNYGRAVVWPHHEAFNFGTDDFTMELWGKGPRAQCWIELQLNYWRGGLDYSWISVYLGPWTAPDLQVSLWASSDLVVPGSYTVFSDYVDSDTWHHMAVVREGTNLNLYVNGVFIGFQQLIVDASFSCNSYSVLPDLEYNFHYLHVSGYTSPPTTAYSYVDEVRIIKGAQYTSNFTPIGPF